MTLGAKTIFNKKTHSTGPFHGWDWARKGSAPAFSSINIAQASQATDKHLAELDEVIEQHVKEKKPFEVADWMTRMTTDMIATSGFGGFPMRAMSSEPGSDGLRFLEDLEIVLIEYLFKTLVLPIRNYFWWNSEVRRAKQSAKNLMALCQRVLDRYRSMNPDPKDSSLVGHLCRSPYPSDKERCADIMTFLVAGHDTTGYSLAWILCEVAKAGDDVQKQLRSDIQSHGHQSPYLAMVIKEGMRLRPVAAQGSLRRLKRDLVLDDGTTILAGSSCMMPQYTIFRDAWIDRATEFIPERWQKDAAQVKELERMFAPFSLGKRDCVGQRMATTQLTKVLAHMFGKYHFSVATEPVEDYFLTLKPAHGTLMIQPWEQ